MPAFYNIVSDTFILTLVEMLTINYSYFSVNFMAKPNIACIS